MAPADGVLTSAGYLLLKAGHHIAVDFETALDALGLSGREFLVMSNVRAADGLSQQALSERLGLDPTLVVGLVDALEDRSYVRRAKDPADRRRNILSLTAAGIAVHDDAVAAARRAEHAFLAPLSAAQREELRAALRAVMAPRLPWLDA
jgi:DNA-binding MarR family transcriptional regulator